MQVLRRLRALLDDLLAVALEEHRPPIEEELARLDSTVQASFGSSVDLDRARVADRQGIGGPTAARSYTGAAGAVTERSTMELGGKFWLAFIGGAIAFAFAGVLLFLLFDAAWARWGFLGTFLILAAGMLLFGWIFDRRQAKRRASYDDALET